MAPSPRRRRVDLVGILEAAYRVEQPEEPWIAGVLDAARSGLDDGFGAYAFTYDATNPSRFGFRAFVTRDLHPVFLDAIRTVNESMSEDLVKEGLWARRASTMSEMPGYESLTGSTFDLGSGRVAHEAIGVNGLDPVGIGCLLSAPWRRRRGLSTRERATWDKVSTHLSAAFRLQRALQAKESSAATDVVLTPSGRVLHAEASAQARPARDALSLACRSIERARSRRGRAQGEVSLSLWRSLVSERWTLVDTYERDAKRYVVARRNELRLLRPEALSPRERQVLGFAVLGDSNKLIAYELGISASTVRVLLHRAMGKLGCRSRPELLQRFAELIAAGAGPAKPQLQ